MYDIDEYLLQESRWDEAKYKLAKLGMIKKGGKFFGRKKQDAKAKAEFDNMLMNVKNDIIKRMHNIIRENSPEFPNCKSREEFLNGLKLITYVYDSICQSCLTTYGAPRFPKRNKEGYPMPVLNPENKMYMDIDIANALIRSLRKYLQKVIDYDLSTAYTVFEACEFNQDEFLESSRLCEEISLNPLKWFKKDKSSVPAISTTDLPATTSNLPAVASNLPANIETDGITKDKSEPKKDNSALTGGKETFTKKEVESKKKELIIGGLGAALGIFGWVMQTDWFKHILESYLNKPQVDATQVKSSIEEVKFNVAKGDGFTQTINKMCGTNLGPNTTTAEFISTMKDKGFGSSASEIVKNLGISSNSPNPNFINDMTGALSHDGPLKNIFTGALSGKSGLLMLKPGPFLAKKITNTIVKVIAKKAVTTGTVAASKLAGLGSVLAPLGIALVAGAATSYLLKRKAKKSSRFKDLQALLEMMDELKLMKNGVYTIDAEIKIPYKKLKSGKNLLNQPENIVGIESPKSTGLAVRKKGRFIDRKKLKEPFKVVSSEGDNTPFSEYEEIKDSKILNFNDFGKVYEIK